MPSVNYRKKPFLVASETTYVCFCWKKFCNALHKIMQDDDWKEHKQLGTALLHIYVKNYMYSTHIHDFREIICRETIFNITKIFWETFCHLKKMISGCYVLQSRTGWWRTMYRAQRTGLFGVWDNHGAQWVRKPSYCMYNTRQGKKRQYSWCLSGLPLFASCKAAHTTRGLPKGIIKKENTGYCARRCA